MHEPHCPKCNGTRFEVREIEPAGTPAVVNLLLCQGCGAAMGVVNPPGITAALLALERNYKLLANAVQGIDESLKSVAHALQRL